MRRSLAFVGATLSVWLMMLVMVIYHLGVGQHLHPNDGAAWDVVGKNNTVSASHRKLLQEDDPFMNRVGPGRRKCSNSDVQVNQEQTLPLPNGIPTYTVVVTNTCPTGCEITKIHFSCGWFGSARLIDPNIFKRIAYNDCLVNGGNPLPSGGALSFQYANTFSYPLSVSSVACLS